MFLSFFLMWGSATAATDDVVFSETVKDLEEAPDPQTNVAAEAGATSSSGNSFSTVIYSNLDASYRWGWREISTDGMIEVGKSVSDADADGTISDCERELGFQTTSEKFSLDLRYDRYLDERNALYALSGWLRDPFSGYQSRIHAQAGYSRQIMDIETQTLVGELGMDVAREIYTDSTALPSSWHYSARGNIEWTAIFGEEVLFAESFEAFVNVENPRDIRVISEASLTFLTTNMLSVKATYLVNHDTQPVEGYRTTDQTLALTLVAVLSRVGGPPVTDEALGFGDDPS